MTREPVRAMDGYRTDLQLTDEVRAWLAADKATDTPEAARDWVRAEQAAARRRIFETSVPDRFQHATYADLEPVLQGRSAVAAWLASRSSTLLLVGPVGCGKTHAAYAVLRDAMERGRWVFGCTVAQYLAAVRPEAPPSPTPRAAEGADLLLLDDLAAERHTEWAVEQVGELIDHRHRERRRQVVTTNATREVLEGHLGPRTVSRLIDTATVIRFDGADRRVTW